jgi:hypothetical protein
MKDVFEPSRNLQKVVIEQIEALGLAEVVESMDSSTLTTVHRKHPEDGHWTMARFLFELINAAYREGQRVASE